MTSSDLFTAEGFQHEVPILPEPAVPVPLGPVLTEYFRTSPVWNGAEQLYERFIRTLLFSENTIPTRQYDRNLNFRPGARFSGKIGPDPATRVMLVLTLPNIIQGATRWDEDESGLVCGNAVDDLLGDYAGVLLKSLDEVGIAKSDWWEFYVTTVMRFPRPTKRAKGAVKASWLREGSALLHHEVAIIEPDVIAAFGTEPAKFFTGYPIKKAQNTVFDYTVNEAWRDEAERCGAEPPAPKVAKVVCVPDPKTVVMNAEKKPQFLAGLTLFKETLYNEQRKETDISAVYVEREEELAAAVDVLLDAGHTTFAVDCEWGGAHWLDAGAGLRTVQIAWSPTEVLVVILRRAGMRPTFSPDMGSAYRHLRRLLQRPEVRVVGHGFSADFPWLSDQGVDLSGQLYFDTMLAAHLFEPTASHVLEDLAVRFIPGWPRHDLSLEEWFDKHYSKKKLEEYGYADVPDELLHPYSARDACATFSLYQKYEADLHKPENAGLYELFRELVMPATLCMINIEMTGIAVDRKRLDALEAQYHSMYEELLTRFRTTIGDSSFNPNSSPQKTKLLFQDLGLTPVKTTGKYPKAWADVVARGEVADNDPACDGETLEILKHKNPVADMLREVCLLGTVTKSFLPEKKENAVTGVVDYQSGFAGFVKRDGRLHTRIGQMIKTGRLSSSSPNLQNCPNRTETAINEVFMKYRPDSTFYKLRTAFVARPGHLLVCCDYKQAEIAALAYLSGDPTLIEAVQAGMDIHSVVCKQMFNLDCSLAEVKEKYKSLRVAAKAIVFGLIYGRGATAIAREVEKAGVPCTVERAQEFIDTFLNQFPLVRALIERAHGQVESDGFVEGAWGRREYFYRTGASDDKSALARQKRQAVNFLPQNYVADLLRKALINLYTYRREHADEISFNVVLTVYDSVVFEVPVKHVQQLVDVVVPKCMVDEARSRRCPFSVAVDTDVSVRWDEQLHLSEFLDMGVDEEFAKRFSVSKVEEDGSVVYPEPKQR